ncbi:DnaD domain-containing protein [Clostridium estertheticum]|uniref:DnaD domain-containing protein n=1 Tax=Clostridium estertheticum TaxID=238834 RepID=UPI001CF461C9|nr:DnaD domain protein [Clostridium estertheticum]MCB2340334.1 DnaD domain protein [Clostridium estertheticum]
MAKYRQIYTEFWSDSFVLELVPEEKFFYLYLLTNTKSTQSGIFEISPKFISIETGYDKVIVAEMLKKFCDYKKILYDETTNEIMILNWIKYNVPDNKNAVVGIQRQLLKIKNKAFLEILYEICKVASLDVDNIFKDIIVNVTSTDKNNLSPMHLDSSEEQSNNIIIKPLSIPLVGATKHVPSNRIKNKEEGVINKEQRIINKEEVEEVEATIKESLVTNSENPAATAVGIKSIIKIFEENIHAITPLVYEKILSFTKYVSDEVVIMAITEAVNYNAKNIKYISSVINSWISEGIKTAKEVVTYQKKWNSNNSSSSINSGSHSVKSGSFCDYEQRTYDFDLLEKQLLGIAQ